MSGKNNKEEGPQRWIKQVMHALTSRTPSVIDYSTLPLPLVQGTERSGFLTEFSFSPAGSLIIAVGVSVDSCSAYLITGSPHSSCGVSVESHGVSVESCSTSSLWFSKLHLYQEGKGYLALMASLVPILC